MPAIGFEPSVTAGGVAPEPEVVRVAVVRVVLAVVGTAEVGLAVVPGLEALAEPGRHCQ